ncbi:MAG TPA: redoxin domain-containing protein [Planctomycetaceae bacterium]|nr:redoxin domain-containing protein [Planctomycetaceae bacterium]
MMELVQLEKRHEDFARRNSRVIVASMEGLEDAQRTQEKFPHLLVLADSGRGLSEAIGLIDYHAAPGGGDADTPTTIVVDRDGVVRWLFRPSEVISRLSPDDVLKAVDQSIPADVN